MSASRGAANTLLPTTRPGAELWLRSREIGVAGLAVAAVVASADIRIPAGLPGHRGAIWLAPLVAIALLARRPESVIAVGAASTATAQILQVAPGVGQSARYLAAAVLLYAASFVPVLGRRAWFIALAAAPIHLVALLGPASSGLHRGLLGFRLMTGSTEKVLYHLAFGLVAGLIGWSVASSAKRLDFVDSTRHDRRPDETGRVR